MEIDGMEGKGCLKRMVARETTETVARWMIFAQRVSDLGVYMIPYRKTRFYVSRFFFLGNSLFENVSFLFKFSMIDKLRAEKERAHPEYLVWIKLDLIEPVSPFAQVPPPSKPHRYFSLYRISS